MPNAGDVPFIFLPHRLVCVRLGGLQGGDLGDHGPVLLVFTPKPAPCQPPATALLPLQPLEVFTPGLRSAGSDFPLPVDVAALQRGFVRRQRWQPASGSKGAGGSAPPSPGAAADCGERLHARVGLGAVVGLGGDTFWGSPLVQPQTGAPIQGLRGGRGLFAKTRPGVCGVRVTTPRMWCQQPPHRPGAAPPSLSPPSCTSGFWFTAEFLAPSSSKPAVSQLPVTELAADFPGEEEKLGQKYGMENSCRRA